MLPAADHRMRILLVSSVFLPSIGGIETATVMFARGLTERGYEVVVVTSVPGGPDDFPFRVVRRPDARTLFTLVRWADLVWHNQVSLRALWPMAVLWRPLILTHQQWLGWNSIYGRMVGGIRRLLCGLGQNVYISKPMADDVGWPGPLIPDGYEEGLFRLMPEMARDRDVAFLGRLIRDKGADILIEAIAMLKPDMNVSATVIGTGPEIDNLKVQAAAGGVADRIVFTGPLRGDALVREINRHRVIAVTSRFAEPFGTVSIEGMACGCVPIGASVGGLPEAIGPCGPMIPKDDPASLARALKLLLTDPDALAAYRARAPQHLAKFTATAILDAYEAIIRKLTKGSMSIKAQAR